MVKGKFARLILLCAFSAGVASSSAVSAQGNESLASVTDVNGIGSYDNSLAVDFNVSDELGDADETEINTEVATDEDFSTDDISNLKVDTENVDESTENETDLPEGFTRENNENKDYFYVDKNKKSEKNRAKKIMDSAVAVGGGTAVASMLVKSFIDGSSDSKSGVDTEFTYKPDSELADTGNEPGNTNASSGNSPESISTNNNSGNDSKSGGIKTGSDTSSDPGGTTLNFNGNDSIYSPAPKPDTKPKSDYSYQNKKNNNLKKSGIGIGAFAAILFVYLCICSNFENKLKNKIVTETKTKINNGDLSEEYYKNGKLENNGLEYKVITVNLKT